MVSKPDLEISGFRGSLWAIGWSTMKWGVIKYDPNYELTSMSI